MERIVFDIILKDLNQAVMEERSHVGLHIKYQNSEGKTLDIILINVKYSSQYGTGFIEADCFSKYRYKQNQCQFGIDDMDFAITSHRTFRVDSIISATIIKSLANM